MKSFLFLSLLCISAISCKSSNAFYEKYKNNTSIFNDLESLIILPERGHLTIELLKYGGVKFRIDGRLPDGNLNYFRCEKAFDKLLSDFNLNYYSADSLLKDIYFKFSSLKILALYSGGNDYYFTLVIDNHHIIIYIPDPNKLNAVANSQIIDRQRYKSVIFDKNWFLYELEKPFIDD